MAEGNIHFDLSEEIEEEVKSIFENFTNTIGGVVGNFAQDVFATCVQATRYKPMLDLYNNMVQLFNEEVKDKAKSALDEWKDGDGSFHASSINSQAGEEAEQVAQQLDEQISDMFDEFWDNKPAGEEESLDTSRPTLYEGAFDDYKERLSNCVSNIESEAGSAYQNVQGLGDDDPTYNLILAPMKALAETIKEAFNAFQASIDQAKEESAAKKSAQDSKNEEAAAAAESTAATASEIADALKMFD